MGRELIDFLKRAKKVNLTLAAANIAVFLILSLGGDTMDARFMLSHGAAYAPLIMRGEYYRLFTSMFLHFGLTHLLYNMVCLLSLGDLLETIVGPVRYFVIYLLGGTAGSLLSLLRGIYADNPAVSAGASGAIFAVIGALLSIVLRLRNEQSRSMSKRLALMAGLMILQGFMERGTDNAAHIGGFAAGVILGFVLWKRPRRINRWDSAGRRQYEDH
ncbi:MAG: rhomboid family intramembrane serine protease [Lachnospiraceae bacterium]|nr:rhomboid family intramembrane serine protease [Lachnospiraceae bacterium]